MLTIHFLNTSGCYFPIEASAPSSNAPTVEHKNEEDKESKKAVLELVLSRCTAKGTASSNSSAKDVRYSLRDAAEACLGTRDSYTVSQAVDDFKKTRGENWWLHNTENDYGHGHYGSREAVNGLIDFIGQQTPDREVLPTPRQAIKSVLEFCDYKEGENDETGINYYNVKLIRKTQKCQIFCVC